MRPLLYVGLFVALMTLAGCGGLICPDDDHNRPDGRYDIC
jgi:predicted small lipoprotein YifL